MGFLIKAGYTLGIDFGWNITVGQLFYREIAAISWYKPHQFYSSTGLPVLPLAKPKYSSKSVR